MLKHSRFHWDKENHHAMILSLIDKYLSLLSQPTSTVSILSIQAYSKRLFAWKDKSRSFVHRVTYRKSFDLMYPRTISACFCDNTRRNKRIILCDQQIQNKQNVSILRAQIPSSIQKINYHTFCQRSKDMSL